MKKIIIGIGVIIALPVAYWLISPLFITHRVEERLEDIMPPSATKPTQTIPQVEKTTPPAQSPQEPSSPGVVEVSRGTFVGLAGHNGQGTSKLLQINTETGSKHYVRFENDFRVTNGPDLFVYFGKDGKYVADARLGELKGNEGGQNYEVPATINPNDYNEVWVWCRAFSVPFAKAELSS